MGFWLKALVIGTYTRFSYAILFCIHSSTISLVQEVGCSVIVEVRCHWCWGVVAHRNVLLFQSRKWTRACTVDFCLSVARTLFKFSYQLTHFFLACCSTRSLLTNRQALWAVGCLFDLLLWLIADNFSFCCYCVITDFSWLFFLNYSRVLATIWKLAIVAFSNAFCFDTFSSFHWTIEAFYNPDEVFGRVCSSNDWLWWSL